MGGTVILVEGYTFSTVGNSLGRYWVCSKKSKFCKARFQLINGKITKFIREHYHMAKPRGRPKKYVNYIGDEDC